MEVLLIILSIWSGSGSGLGWGLGWVLGLGHGTELELLFGSGVGTWLGSETEWKSGSKLDL